MVETRDIIAPQNDAPDFLAEDQWFDVDYRSSLLDMDAEMVYPEYTIKLNGARCAPVTGVMVISGQSGQGKTQTSTMIMSAYLGADIEGIELIWEKTDPMVLYVDTEMELGNTQLVVARVQRICGCDMEHIKRHMHVLRLRDEENHENIWRKILRAIYELKPDVVMLDGMIDIIGDFNDNQESNSIIRKILKLADHYKIPLWTVMHQNPGSTKMVGHQGSFLERKATMVVYTVKVTDDENTRLYHFELRNAKQRGEDITPLCFHMEVFELPNGTKNAYPVTGKAPHVQLPQSVERPDPMKMPTEDMRDFFLLTMTNQQGTSKRQLREAIEQEYQIGHTKADAFITRAEKEGIISRDDNMKPYRLVDNTASQDGLPF